MTELSAANEVDAKLARVRDSIHFSMDSVPSEEDSLSAAEEKMEELRLTQPAESKDFEPMERVTKIKFKDVIIREMDLVAGDSPSCSVGVPISLGWNVKREMSLPLDEYERQLVLQGIERKTLLQMQLMPDERVKLLRKSGESKVHIALAIQRVKEGHIRNAQEIEKERSKARLRKLASMLGFGKKKKKNTGSRDSIRR